MSRAVKGVGFCLLIGVLWLASGKSPPSVAQTVPAQPSILEIPDAPPPEGPIRPSKALVRGRRPKPLPALWTSTQEAILHLPDTLSAAKCGVERPAGQTRCIQLAPGQWRRAEWTTYWECEKGEPGDRCAVTYEIVGYWSNYDNPTGEGPPTSMTPIYRWVCFKPRGTP